MNMEAGRLTSLVVLAAMLVAGLWVIAIQLRRGLRDEKFLGRGGVKFSISRKDQPITFWTQIGFLIVVGIAGIWAFFYVLFRAISRHDIS